MAERRTITRESEAWFALAEQWEVEPKEFLCYAVLPELWHSNTEGAMQRVGRPIRELMHERIREDLGQHSLSPRHARSLAAALYEAEMPLTTDDDIHAIRVLACLMFGWEALDREKGVRVIRRLRHGGGR